VKTDLGFGVLGFREEGGGGRRGRRKKGTRPKTEGISRKEGRREMMQDASKGGVGGIYVKKVVQSPDVNKNTSWFQYPGVWITYILIIFISWLLILSVLRCDAGTAWTIVNLGHFAVSPTPLSLCCVFLGFTTFFLSSEYNLKPGNLARISGCISS
jgi:hypothetical protein